MQNHLEISSKTQFWIRNVRNWTKSRDLVMSGPVQEDPYGPHKGSYGPLWAHVSDCWFNFACFGAETEFSTKFLNDSACFCEEKLKKHGFETKKQQDKTTRSKNINKHIKKHYFQPWCCLIQALMGPCGAHMGP